MTRCATSYSVDDRDAKMPLQASPHERWGTLWGCIVNGARGRSEYAAVSLPHFSRGAPLIVGVSVGTYLAEFSSTMGLAGR